MEEGPAEEANEPAAIDGPGAVDHLGRREPSVLFSSIENYIPAELGTEANEYLNMAPKRRRRRVREFVLACLTIAAVFMVWGKVVDTKGVWLYAQATWANITHAATTIAKSDDVAPIAKTPSETAMLPSYARTPPSSPDLAEELPPSGRSLILSTEEVRYCVFQGRRLQFMRSRIKDDGSVQRFNGLVGDFNARCGNFRFLNNALQTATQEADSQQGRLEGQAIRMMAAWQTLPAQSLVDLNSHDGALQIQAKLKSLGFFNHPVDGVWGPRSADALSRFRRQNSLGDDSTWDLATQSALLAH